MAIVDVTILLTLFTSSTESGSFFFPMKCLTQCTAYLNMQTRVTTVFKSILVHTTHSFGSHLFVVFNDMNIIILANMLVQGKRRGKGKMEST